MKLSPENVSIVTRIMVDRAIDTGVENIEGLVQRELSDDNYRELKVLLEIGIGEALGKFEVTA